MGEKNKIELDTTVAVSEELVSSDLSGEIVRMSIESGNYYGLDEIGSHIWTLLEEPQSVATLCAALVQEFEVEQTQCEEDVLAFLNELASDELVKISDAPTS